MPPRSWVGALAGARAAAPEPGRTSSRQFTHGSLEARFYQPRGHDPQTPHGRDEIYVVAVGSGVFVADGARTPFGAGDCLFVAAGVTHHFEEFTDDFGVWVFFYGPEGGEAT
jgi:mannose-6-phosphate isomerase-like protein (cupin superfamily)